MSKHDIILVSRKYFAKKKHYGIFSRKKKEKENAMLIEGVTFEECLNDLLGDPDEEQLRRAFAYYDVSDFFSNKDMESVPEASGTVFAILLQYYNELPQNMDIVASNITVASCELIEDAENRDPYKSKELLEKVFAKWPKAFHAAMRRAEEDEEDEYNLIFLCCVNLFGWNCKTNIPEAERYVSKIEALDDIKYYSVFEWLKKEVADRKW